MERIYSYLSAAVAASLAEGASTEPLAPRLIAAVDLERLVTVKHGSQDSEHGGILLQTLSRTGLILPLVPESLAGMLAAWKARNPSVHTYSFTDQEADDAVRAFGTVDLSKVIAIRDDGAGNVLVQTAAEKGLMLPFNAGALAEMVTKWKTVSDSIN